MSRAEYPGQPGGEGIEAAKEGRAPEGHPVQPLSIDHPAQDGRLAVVARMQSLRQLRREEELSAAIPRALATCLPSASTVALLLTSVDRSALTPLFIAVEGSPTAGVGLASIPVGSGSISLALQSSAPVITSPPDSTLARFVPGFADCAAATTEIAAPLVHGETMIGVLVAQSGHPGARFSQHDAEILDLIGGHAAAAIRTARLLEEVRLSRKIGEASALIARTAVGSLGPHEVCRAILEAVDRVVSSQGSALALTGESGARLRYWSARGTLQGMEGLSLPASNSALSVLRPQGRPFVPEPAALASLGESAFVSLGALILPLVAHGRVLGALWSQRAAGIRFGPPELESLTRLAAPISLATDVMVLAEGEKDRRKRERMLASALATMDQPVFVLGTDRRIRYANAAAGLEYGYAAEELGDRSFDDLVEAAAPDLRGRSPEGQTTGRFWTAEQVHRRHDGTTFPASVLLSTIRDEGLAVSGQVVAVRNLSEERRIEEQLRQSEKLAALGELVAGVAHELNNPLAGISAFAQLMLEDDLAEEHLDSARLIKREADRAVGVIRDLLVFSRKSAPAREPLDVNELIARALRLRNYSLRSTGVDVQLDLQAPAPLILGDDQRLQQVLLNLVLNAEAALQGVTDRRLVIRSATDNRGVVITVADSGIGMAESTRRRIFEPFFTTKAAGEGTGLGLSVSYGIIRAHGGSMSVASEPGQGAVFTIVVPAMTGQSHDARSA